MMGFYAGIVSPFMTAWRPRPFPAQVTNTPWNERVTFVFDPKGAEVKKALHVSPFMDMDGTWWVVVGGGGRQLVHRGVLLAVPLPAC